MQLNKKSISIQLFAFIGLLLSIELAIVYYNANYNEYALSSFCSINNFVDCDGVAKTVHSQFCGIPLAYWGIFLYTIILFLTVVDRLKNIKIFKFLEVFKNPNSYISALGFISFLCSMVLAFISINVIHKICILCFVTYFIDLFIAFIASECNLKNIAEAFKVTFKDFISGVKLYPKTFITLSVIAAVFLAYSGITLNFVPRVKRTKAILKYRDIKYNPYRVSGNVLGNPDGNVVIEIYSDYVCPLCYINNIMLHQAVKEYKNIKVIHYNYPFDKECNQYMDFTAHVGACFMSKGALAAKKQGNYWEMSSLIYENQPKNLSEMAQLAEKLNFDEKKFLDDLESKEISDELSAEISRSATLNVEATPTMIINGNKEVGVKPYYQLKEILEKYGAEKK